MKLSFIAILILAAVTSNVAASDWSYTGGDGPSHWATNYPKCAGQSQSPINVNTSTAQNDNFGTFSMVGFEDVTDKNMTVVNTGHSLQVNLVGDYSVSGGGLDGKYITAQFHFHWGKIDAEGSEHLVNDVAYPVEMHMVHFSNRFTTLTDALGDPTGVAVLAFFFQVSEEDNPNFDTLLDAVANVSNAGAQYQLPSAFTLKSMLPEDLSEFYRYSGSLTTPACNEAVVWTIFKQRIDLSSNQIAVLRTLQNNGEAIQDNFRPIQLLNDRTVSFSSPDNEPSHGSIIAPSFIISMLSFFILFAMK